MAIPSKSRSYSRRSAWAFVLVGVLAGVSVGGGVGVIAASSTKTVTVCADKKTNMLRYVKKGKCAKTETMVVLNQSGVAGTKGADGTAGAKGDAGVAGTKGADGTAGAKGDAGTNGTNATLAITQQSVCDGTDEDTVANEVCKVGMTGPGGGHIFFVDYNNEYATYDYLEAASTDGVFASSVATGVWATTTTNCGGTAPQATDCQTATIYTETGVGLATIKGLHRGLFGGKAATAAIVARHDAGSVAKNTYAAGVADDYAANGITDWWLPSRDELQKMQENLNNKGVGRFSAGYYWSSSEYGYSYAWEQSPFSGSQDFGLKFNAFYVRPVRAF